MTLRPAPFRYCPACRHEGLEFLRQHELRCPSCRFRYFHSVATAVGALLVHEGKTLFIERGLEPAKGKLGLPGGFVDPGQSSEQALAREVREEVGGQIGKASLIASFPNEYQFANSWYHTCDFYFRAELLTPPGELVIDPVEVKRLVWREPSEVDPEELAFPSLRALWAFLHAGSS